MTEKTRSENEPEEFMLNTGISMIELYFREQVFTELALDGAVNPEATGPFTETTNARVRKTMREIETLVQQHKQNPSPNPHVRKIIRKLEALVWQYKQNPPTQNGGKQ